MNTIKLYGTPLSGHCHRVSLLLDMLQIPYEFVEAAAMRQSAEFLQLNPLGQVPVLTDGDLVLCDSNAILVYLAKRYATDSKWLSDDAVEAAHIQRWLSIAAGEVRYGPASARMTSLWKLKGEVDIALAATIAAKLLRVMNAHLADRNWLATERPTIADLACYSYVAHASEGRISLEPYPAVRAWLKRVEGLPKFRPMPTSVVPSAS